MLAKGILSQLFIVKCYLFIYIYIYIYIYIFFFFFLGGGGGVTTGILRCITLLIFCLFNEFLGWLLLNKWALILYGTTSDPLRDNDHIYNTTVVSKPIEPTSKETGL